jgi:chaperonin cofactor prefoldin
MNKIQQLVAELRNKLTPFTNLAYLTDDAKDLNAVGNIIYNESKKCKDLTPIVKELLENINKESDSLTWTDEDMIHAIKTARRLNLYECDGSLQKWFRDYKNDLNK